MLFFIIILIKCFYRCYTKNSLVNVPVLIKNNSGIFLAFSNAVLFLIINPFLADKLVDIANHKWNCQRPKACGLVVYTITVPWFDWKLIVWPSRYHGNKRTKPNWKCIIVRKKAALSARFWVFDFDSWASLTSNITFECKDSCPDIFYKYLKRSFTIYCSCYHNVIFFFFNRFWFTGQKRLVYETISFKIIPSAESSHRALTKILITFF